MYVSEPDICPDVITPEDTGAGTELGLDTDTVVTGEEVVRVVAFGATSRPGTLSSSSGWIASPSLSFSWVADDVAAPLPLPFPCPRPRPRCAPRPRDDGAGERFRLLGGVAVASVFLRFPLRPPLLVVAVSLPTASASTATSCASPAVSIATAATRSSAKAAPAWGCIPTATYPPVGKDTSTAKGMPCSPASSTSSSAATV